MLYTLLIGGVWLMLHTLLIGGCGLCYTHY